MIRPRSGIDAISPAGSSRIVAGIDVGSNTIRLAVAACDPGEREFITVKRELKTTRLGRGLAAGGRLHGDAVDESLRVLADYTRRAKRAKAQWVVCIGTGALRDAADGAEFRDQVRAATGLSLNIISQKTEARLALAGAATAVVGPPMTVLDIGGRTTEIIIDRIWKSPKVYGYPLGAVSLSERFIRHDPPLRRELRRLREHITAVLGSARLPSCLPRDAALIGTGGTFTTLAAVRLKMRKYKPDKINGAGLDLAELETLLESLAAKKEVERAALPGMEPGRVDIIIAGTALAAGLARRLGGNRLIVSDSGILEGCILAGLHGTPRLRRTPFRELV